MEWKVILRKPIFIFLVFASMLLGQTASMPDTVAFVGGTVSIPITVTNIETFQGLEFTVQFDENIIDVSSASFVNSELEGMNYVLEYLVNSNEINVLAFAGGSIFTGSGILLYLIFDVVGEQLVSTDLTFMAIEINNISILGSAQNGSVVIHQPGCMDVDACNYDASATYDEGNYCNELDCEDICGGITIYDCNGECGGLVLNDECGVCGGNSLSCSDCAGVPNGAAVEDQCGICDNDSSNNCVQDCSGEWAGNLVIDECGICGGSGPTEECGCEQIPQGDCDCNGNVNDVCDVCGGDGCHQGDCETYPADEFDCYGVLLSTDLLSPFEFKLLTNYPNPFNPSTTINYSVATFSVVNISIYSMSGELIHTLVNTSQQPGQYTIQWNALNSPSGLYFVKLKSENKIAEQKVLLIK